MDERGWMDYVSWFRNCVHGLPRGVGGVGSVVLADRAKCAKITDLFKQSAGGDEDTGEKADTSAWCAGSRCFVMLTCYVL